MNLRYAIYESSGMSHAKAAKDAKEGRQGLYTMQVCHVLGKIDVAALRLRQTSAVVKTMAGQVGATGRGRARSGGIRLNPTESRLEVDGAGGQCTLKLGRSVEKVLRIVKSAKNGVSTIWRKEGGVGVWKRLFTGGNKPGFWGLQRMNPIDFICEYVDCNFFVKYP